MRRKRVRQEEDADIDITPMLDIVFIMLIFFIVTATFVKESGIDVTRPDAETASNRTASPFSLPFATIMKSGLTGGQVDLASVRAM